MIVCIVRNITTALNIWLLLPFLVLPASGLCQRLQKYLGYYVLSPGFRLPLVQASPARVEPLRSLVQVKKVTIFYYIVNN